VGHIRSTIIGDSLCRIARFLGFDVIADNHIGDWGTQFGMILHGWKTALDHDALAADPIRELVRVYRGVNAAAKDDPAVMETCKAELVKLQAGDPENLAIWQQCIDVSKSGLQKIYDILDVKFDHWLGESFYNGMLPGLVDEFIGKHLARESNGAICIFSDGSKPQEQDPFLVHKEDGWTDNPAIIRKADGGFLYATTDLATILYRVEAFQANEVIYLTDARQQDHFQQLFLTTEKWFQAKGYPLPLMRHVWWGTILGEDKKPFKTKSGKTIRLQDILDEARERAFAVVTTKNPALPEDERRNIAEAVGIGAVKYADLSSNRTQDYVFDWERMLSFDGNTAPYLLYAVARINSIFRKAGLEPDSALPEASPLETGTELALARKLLGLVNALELTLNDLRPHFLCTYLYELASAYSSFNNADRVLVDEADVRARRLLLCARTRTVLKTGLELLGIRTLEQM